MLPAPPDDAPPSEDEALPTGPKLPGDDGGVAVLVAALVVVALATSLLAYGLDRWPWWAVAGLVVVAGGSFALAARWYLVRSSGRTAGWYLVAASAGTLVVLFGAILLRLASAWDAPGVATAGVVTTLTGLVPVAGALRSEVMTTEGTSGWARRREVLAGLGLNALFAALSAGVALVIVGAPPMLALGVAAAWVVASWAVRVGRALWDRDRRLLVGGIGVLAAGVAGFVVAVATIDPERPSLVVAVGGIVAALGAVELIAAWSRNLEGVVGDRTVRLTAAAGLVLLVAGALAMLQQLGTHVGVGVQVLVIGACVLVGAGFAFRVQGFLLVALLGGVVVWTVVPRVDPAPLDPHPEATQRIVVLGDSYSSGEGAELFFPDTNVEGANNCRRSASSYGYLVADELGLGLDHLACSGARARHLAQTGQVPEDEDGPVGGLPQLENDVGDDPPALVLLSIGGNDAYFGHIGRGCVAPGSCTDNERIFRMRLATVRAVVTDALVEVAREFPESPIVVVPYPRMLAEDATGSPSCSLPLDDGERAFLASFLPELNATIAGAVAAADRRLATEVPGAVGLTWFADGEDAYAGNELCATGTEVQPLNRVEVSPTDGVTLFRRLNPGSWAHNGLHPTAQGHRLMADALLRWLDRDALEAGDPTAMVPDEEPPPPSLPDDDQRRIDEAELSAWMNARVVVALAAVVVPGSLLVVAGLLLDIARRWHAARPAPPA